MGKSIPFRRFAYILIRWVKINPATERNASSDHVGCSNVFVYGFVRSYVAVECNKRGLVVLGSNVCGRVRWMYISYAFT